MTTSIVGEAPAREHTAGGSGGMTRLLILFTLSGMAGLIYEVVWFQLLRLTIGTDAQSLGILLACFMAGLFVGSFSYARVVPAKWHPLRTYAVLELGIGAMALAMPYAIGWIRAAYLSHAASPQATLVWRCLIATGLLLPPTILMGATLPALARWVRSDERQVGSIGRLYAINIIGAVVGTLGGALALLPWLGVVGANMVGVGINAFVALVAGTMRLDYHPPHTAELAISRDVTGGLPVYLAYSLNGAAALSFEVLWSRLLSMAFGATVYAFALVLGVFLLGLGTGGVVGSAWAPRLRRPRRAFAALQLSITAAIAGTPWLMHVAPLWFIDFDTAHAGDPWLLTLTNLVRATAIVFPGAFLWGMSFPFALAGLGKGLGDAARPVGKLYAYNTVGAVIGSLATSFVLIPQFGSSVGTAHVILLPVAAAVVLLLPARWPGWIKFVFALAVVVVALATPLASLGNEQLRDSLRRIDDVPVFVWSIVGAAVVGVGMILATYVRYWWSFLLASAAICVAFTTAVPVQLYMFGRYYAYRGVGREFAEVLAFEEGAMEPVVVFRDLNGTLQVAINSKVCASTVPEDMTVQRLLGHLPVMLSSDPSNVLVVGLGAGVTAGAVSVHDAVKHLDIVELEPKVAKAARLFGDYNAHVLDNPKTNVIIEDGRHLISTTKKKYGVITSDPIAPFLAGSAMLYTVQYYQACRDALIDGGVFCQWMGMSGMDDENVKSLLAAFAEAFPGGTIWITQYDVVMVGSTKPMHIDVQSIARQLAAEPVVRESLAEVGLGTVDNLLSCFVCTCKSLSGFLQGVVPNRDSTLGIQYTGWMAYYERRLLPVERLFVGLRDYDPNVFILPAGEAQSFREKIEKEWSRYEKALERREKAHAERMRQRRAEVGD